MRYTKSDRAGGDVHLSAMAPTSMDRAYHKVWEWVKGIAPTATSWGWGETDEIVEKTICKISHEFPGSLLCNDKASVALRTSDRSADGLDGFLRTCALGHEGAHQERSRFI